MHSGSPTPKPLQILKEARQRSAESQFRSSNRHRNLEEMPESVQESSLLQRYDNEHRHQVFHHESRHLNRAQSQVATVVDNTSHADEPLYEELFNHDSFLHRNSTTTGPQSTPESQRSRSYSNASSAILGDFVAVDAPKMPFSARDSSKKDSPFNAMSSKNRPPQTLNPYEFEHGSPSCDPDYQEMLQEVIMNKDQINLSPRKRHVKARRSEGNAIFMTQAADTSELFPQRNPRRIKRSESSPSLTQKEFSPHHRRGSPSPDLPRYYYGEAEDRVRASSPSRGRQMSNSVPVHSRLEQIRDARKIASCRHERAYSDAVISRSPTRSRWERQVDDATVKGSAYERHAARSPTRTLNNVMEGDEFGNIENNTVPEPPKKRSRSPMKKMFGEKGWLGRSPHEADDLKVPQKVAASKKQSAHTKTSMIGLIRNKLDEFAEKADMNPFLSSRPASEKHPKLSMLSVSLGPPEQARIHMEIELMMVVSANNYLMTQFSQGRIAVDSIKKVVDDWRSKGRPVVIEFMYDQATQRDLVAINQHNFRFHGERAGDGIRINSMLYNWKQVAGLMAVRTFCNADTIILKLLFDVEQILELLGAAETIMLRLQHIRATANESIRLTRQKTAFPNGREMSWDSQNPNEAFSAKHSMEDPFGDLKLIPDLHSK